VRSSITFWLAIAAILAIGGAIFIQRISTAGEEPLEVAAPADIYGGIKSAIDDYKNDVGHYPSNLRDMLQQPRNANNWKGPYFDPPELPIDPWGNPYLYQFPGSHNTNSYDLWSAGPDGKSGTDDDIGNWVTTK
jgi:general secretion pathway protein G